MQRKVPAENERATAVQVEAAAGPSCAEAEGEEEDAGRDHQREAEVDQVGPPAGRLPIGASG